MKFLCFILIALTLLLSSSPCCAGDECCNETGKGSGNSTENHHSEEPSNSCSPFMVCGSCTGFVVIAGIPDLNSEPVIADDQNIPYFQLYLDNYCLKFWQPPKIS